MLDDLWFVVGGSAGSEYRVVLSQAADSVRMTCTCQAAQHGQQCRHRIALLCGDADAVIGGDVDQVAVLSGRIAGTELAAAMNEYLACEAKKQGADRAFKAAKKRLAKSMTGQA